MERGLISVIVPCYNQAQYLDECLQSVLDQTYQNWECIIVNDGSSDNTEEVAIRWIKKDGRFKYYYKKNGGLSSARNAGLKIAIGKFIQFLDSDDFISKEKFSLQVDDLENYDVSICDYINVDNDLDIINEKYLSPFSKNQFSYTNLILEWEKSLSIPCHCVLFKNKQIFFNVDLKNHEDWVFWLKLFYNNNKIFYNNNKLAFYRFSGNSMSTKTFEMKIGFISACDFMCKFYKRKKDRVNMNLIILKRKSLLDFDKLNYKESIAKKFPQLYKTFKKYVK